MGDSGQARDYLKEKTVYVQQSVRKILKINIKKCISVSTERFIVTFMNASA